MSFRRKESSLSENCGFGSLAAATFVDGDKLSSAAGGFIRSDTASVISWTKSTITPSIPIRCCMYTASATLLQQYKGNQQGSAQPYLSQRLQCNKTHFSDFSRKSYMESVVLIAYFNFPYVRRESFDSLILGTAAGFWKMALTSETTPCKPPSRHSFAASSKEFLLMS